MTWPAITLAGITGASYGLHPETWWEMATFLMLILFVAVTVILLSAREHPHEIADPPSHVDIVDAPYDWAEMSPWRYKHSMSATGTRTTPQYPHSHLYPDPDGVNIGVGE